MKDAVMTVRLSSNLRRRVEELASREGRSLSQQVGRLIEQAIGTPAGQPEILPPRRVGGLSGVLRGGRVPTLADFRDVRALISRSLDRRGRTHDKPRR